MIIFIRYLLTIGFSLGGLFCIALMIVDGFNWALTGMAMLAGLFCYCVRPSSEYDDSRSFAGEFGSNFIGELILEGLFRLITWPIRILLHALFD